MPHSRRVSAIIASTLGLVLSALGQAAHANESCFASLLNRTAQLDSTGYFRLDNVPSGIAKSRVRIVCTDSGRVRLGSSEVFAIPAGEGYGVGPILWDSIPPIPQTIDFALPDTVRSSEGIPLVVRGHFADGSEAVLSDSVISWISSNNRLGAIETLSVFKPRSSGRVLLTASVEGVVRLRSVVILLGADRDQDGLPDDWEIANGLDPNQPLDALEDLDGDGLSALDEFRLGTLIRQADSDSDGLKDGEEGPIGTNPLIADTDGDLVPDGLEVELGTNPLVAGPQDLEKAAISLRVEPSNMEFLLPVLNPHITTGKYSITAILKNGREVDASSAVHVSAANLAIAVFGQDGTVEAISEGYTGANFLLGEKFQVSAFVTVRRDAPVPLSVVEFFGFPYSLQIRPGIVFLATGAQGIQVFDVSDPNLPVFLYQSFASDDARGLVLRGDSMWVASGDRGVYLFDVSNPSSFSVLQHWAGDGYAAHLAIHENHLIVASNSGTLTLLEAATLMPIQTGYLRGPNPLSIAVNKNGTSLAVARGVSGVEILPINDAGFGASFLVKTRSASGVAWNSDVDLLVSDGAGPALGGISWIEMIDSIIPVVRKISELNISLQGVSGQEGIFAAADVYAWNTLPIYRMTPDGPIVVTSIDLYSLAGAADDNIYAAGISNNLGFSAGGGYGGIFSGSKTSENPDFSSAISRLYISQLWRNGELDGQIPASPLVSPVPVDGQQIRQGHKSRFSATPRGIVDVRSVRMRCIECLDSSAQTIASPWLAEFRMPSTGDSVTIEAVAVSQYGKASKAIRSRWSLVSGNLPDIRWLSPLDSIVTLQHSRVDFEAEIVSSLGVERAGLFDSSNNSIRGFVNSRSPNLYETGIEFDSLGVFAYKIVVFDSVGGRSETELRHMRVEIDQVPPVLGWLFPASDTQSIIEGSSLPVKLLGFDNVGIQYVEIHLDGRIVTRLAQAPFEANLGGWAGVGVHKIQAFAVDVNGNTSDKITRFLNVEQAQSASIEGIVLGPSGEYMPHVPVTVVGLASSSTDSFGRYLIDGLPAQRGPVGIQVETVRDGKHWIGHSDLVSLSGGIKMAVGPIHWSISEELYGWGRGSCYSGLEGRDCEANEGDSVLQYRVVRPSRIIQAPDRYVSVQQLSYDGVLAVDTSGRLWSWGYSRDGNLGLAHPGMHYRPYPVIGIGRVAQIASWSTSSQVLDSAGRVWVMGRSWDSTYKDWEGVSALPLLQPLEEITQVATGSELELALGRDGLVWSRGNNQVGQLGLGSTTSADGSGFEGHWQPIPALGHVRAIRASLNIASALDSLGRIWRWGSRAIWDTRPCSSSVWNEALGQYESELSTCSGSWDTSRPALFPPPGEAPVVDIAEGGNSSLWALDSRGQLWAYGVSSCPEFGTSDCPWEALGRWTKLVIGQPIDTIQVSRQNLVVVFRTRDGMWSSFSVYDQLPQPRTLAVPPKARSVSLENGVVLIADSAGTLYGRGSNTNAGIPYSPSLEGDTLRPLSIAFRVEQIPVSKSANDGIVWRSGADQVKGLGIDAGGDQRGWAGSQGTLNSPLGISQVFHGYNGIHVLDSFGDHWFWGREPGSGFGSGVAPSGARFDTLTAITGARRYQRIGGDAFEALMYGLVAPDSMELWGSGYGYSPVGLKLPGRLKSWSSNGYTNVAMLFESGRVGLLGSCSQGECGRRSYPAPFTSDTRDSIGNRGVEILDLPPAQDAKTVYGGTLVVLRDGTVWATGYSGNGTLGLGQFSDYVYGFRQVPGLVGIDHLETSYGSVLAIGRDGRAWSWGTNASLDFANQIDWSPKLLPVSNVGEASLSGSERFFLRTGPVKGSP